MKQSRPQDIFKCIFCNELVDEIFIRCEKCQTREPPNICLECFSSGLENEWHKNNHAYRVINLNKLKTFQDWALYDEIQLNSMLTDYNSGKPLEPAHSSSSKFSVDDCLKHLETWYDLLGSNQQPRKKLKKQRLRSTIVLFKEPNSNQAEPSGPLAAIRPSVHSKLFRVTSGYRAARGDFETETRENFEAKHIADLDFGSSNNQLNPVHNDFTEMDVDSIDDDQLVGVLKMSVLGAYNEIIRERSERKKLVRDFGLLPELTQNCASGAKSGLINSRTNALQYQPLVKPAELIHDNVSHLQKFNTDSVHYWSLPPKFVRLYDDFESYAKSIELFNHFGYLKQRLNELREYRSQGLRSLKHVPIYNTYKLKRLNRVSTSHMASLFTCLSRIDLEQQANENGREQQFREWFRRFVQAERTLNNCADDSAIDQSIGSGTGSTNLPSQQPICYPATHMKYKNNPLKVEDYPDCDKLDDDEKEFCRVARVQPLVYLRVKGVLIGENKKAGFCSYARARKIAGIDVNKTRLIHNLLLKLNLITSVLTKKEPIENG